MNSIIAYIMWLLMMLSGGDVTNNNTQSGSQQEQGRSNPHCPSPDNISNGF